VVNRRVSCHVSDQNKIRDCDIYQSSDYHFSVSSNLAKLVANNGSGYVGHRRRHQGCEEIQAEAAKEEGGEGWEAREGGKKNLLVSDEAFTCFGIGSQTS